MICKSHFNFHSIMGLKNTTSKSLQKVLRQKHAIDYHDHVKIIAIFLLQQRSFRRWGMDLSDKQQKRLILELQNIHYSLSMVLLLSWD